MRRRNAVVMAVLLALLAGCRASGEVDVDENDGEGGVEVDVGNEDQGS
jgi:hypothetical protein